MPQFNYYLEKRKDKEGNIIEKNVPILFSFCFDGNRLKSTVGERIDKNRWDVKNERVKSGKSKLDVNNILDDFREKVFSIYRQGILLKEDVTPQYIIRKLREDKTKGKSIIEYYEEFIKISKNTVAYGTLKNYKAVKTHLSDYIEKKRKALRFEDFDHSLFEDLNAYFITDKKMTNNTIVRIIKNLKRFLNWGIEKGYHSNEKFRSYKVSMKEGEIVVLSLEELLKIYNLEIERESLRQVRDVFCFGCFTGLRFSDIQNLKRNQIKDDMIHINVIKTKETIDVPLNDYSKAILNKYSHLPDEKCLPVISNQKSNDHLKIIGQMAELEEKITLVRYQGAKRIEETLPKHKLLTTHIARKTFITNAFRLGFPAEIIMMISGHKDYKVFKRYNKIAQDQLKAAMSKFNIVN